jgi:4-hydroxyphenylpyruvate dioxygenase
MDKSQIAINSISTSGDSLPQRLEAYAGAGFRNVELHLPHVKQWLEGGHSIEDARRLLDDLELTCIGGFEGGVEAFSPADRRKANHEQIVANCEMLQALGGTALVVGTDGPDDPMNIDVIGAMAEVFAELAERVASTGVTLCIEFNWSPVVKSIRTAAAVARNADHPNVGVLFDPAHYHCTPSKFEQLTRDNVAMIKHVHVDDMANKPGELSDCNSDRVLPGEGCLDLKALFGRIEEHGYSGYFSIEMFNQDLWDMAAEKAAKLMHQSMVELCG